MKNKDKNKGQKLSAGVRINRNTFLLLLSQESFQGEVKRARSKFKIPAGGFTAPKDLSNWTTWLCEDVESRLNTWRNFITSILQKEDLHEGFRDAVDLYIQWNRFDPNELRITNYRIVRHDSKTDAAPWKQIHVDFFGPVSKDEMLELRIKISRLMSAITKSDWVKPLTSKQDLKQTFVDREQYKNLATYVDADGVTQRRNYSDLVDADEEASEKQVRREAEAKRKSIQRFNKRMSKKK